jgi:hypothetical protein
MVKPWAITANFPEANYIAVHMATAAFIEHFKLSLR